MNQPIKNFNFLSIEEVRRRVQERRQEKNSISKEEIALCQEKFIHFLSVAQ